ncbi:hypothetical protein Hanom_Chr08g00682001 [Helianthus anomalus]
MAMGICRQGSLSGGELGREIPSAVRGTVQLPFFNPFVISDYRRITECITFAMDISVGKLCHYFG